MTDRAEARAMTDEELSTTLAAAHAVREERAERRRKAIEALLVSEHEVNVLANEQRQRQMLQRDIARAVIGDDIEMTPALQEFLYEHRRREELPRQVCPSCQFEYTDEQAHVCRPVPS